MLKRTVGIAAGLILPTALAAQAPGPDHRASQVARAKVATRVVGSVMGPGGVPVVPATPADPATRATPATPAAGGGAATPAARAVPATPAVPASPSRRPESPGRSGTHRP